MFKHRQKSRQFERLETRYALAGNVTATVDGSGNLLVEGDALANGFILREFSTGKFDLTGINAGSSGTTINGGATNGTLRLNGVTGAVTVRGGEGNDTIQIPYFNFGGRFIVNTGNGDDTLSLGADAKASYLVGTLSIRTFEGKDTVTERNINVIGNQDCSATKLTDPAATATGNKQTYSVTNSTFGSFVYFNFGGREAKMVLNNIVTAGYVSILDPLIQTVNRDGFGGTTTTLKPITRSFEVSLSNISVGGTFKFISSANTQMTVNGSSVGEDANFQGIGTNNSYEITDSSFDSLITVSKSSYTYSTKPAGYIYYVSESLTDDYTLMNVTVNEFLDLDSTGSIELNAVNAKEAVIRAYDNDDAEIDVRNSVFENLSIELGSVGDPNASGATAGDSRVTDSISATIFNCTISSQLFFDLSSRASIVQPVSYEGPGIPHVSRSLATATYNVSSSVIGSLTSSTPDFSNLYFVYRYTNPASTTNFNISTSTIDEVILLCDYGNENILFSGSYVKNSTYADGLPGTDSFINSGSILTNLTKVNFES